jgi:WD40 repeat protein
MGPARRLTTFAWLFVAAGAFAFPKLPAVDRHGDPPPQGAVGRLGTVQLRSACNSLHFPADGKTLVGVDGRLVRIWNAVDGRLIDTRRIPGADAQDAELSADGRTVALAAGSTVELWDPSTGGRLNLSLPKDRRQIKQFAVSNDRRRVLCTQHSNSGEQIGGRLVTL